MSLGLSSEINWIDGRGSQAEVLYYYLHLDTVAANIGPRGRFLTLPRKLIVICHYIKIYDVITAITSCYIAQKMIIKIEVDSH